MDACETQPFIDAKLSPICVLALSTKCTPLMTLHVPLWIVLKVLPMLYVQLNTMTVMIEVLDARIVWSLEGDLLEDGMLSNHIRLKMVVVGHRDGYGDIALIGSANLIHLETDDCHALPIETLHDVVRQVNWREAFPENLLGWFIHNIRVVLRSCREAVGELLCQVDCVV